MGKKQDGRDAEMEALMSIEGVDSAKIAEQIRGKSDEPPVGTPPPATPPIVPPIIPPVVPPVPPVDPKNVLNPETIRAAMLHEMWGEQFKTVEDFKKANIPASLQELPTLRQRNQELETQLKAKPKHNFASDDIAKFNEFVRDTGIKDAAVFNKLNVTDVANMGDMDALVMQHIIENPSSAGKEPQVRRYFETRYNVDSSKIDPKRVESGDLTQEELEQNKLDYESNLIGVTTDGGKAKAKLQELKGKIKMPEFSADEPANKSKWTPDVETKQKAAWTEVNEKMGAEFAKIPITLKGGKEPIVNFVLPEESQKVVLKNALDYVVSNQMEVNQANVTSVAEAMYSDILFTHREEIYHAIFERARSMTEEEILKVYHNPSPKNTDNAPAAKVLSTEDEQRQKAYELENKR